MGHYKLHRKKYMRTKSRKSSKRRPAERVKEEAPAPTILSIVYRLPSETYLNAIARDMHKTAKAKGWWKGKNGDLKGKLLLVHSEVSEAVEEFRAGYPLNEVRWELDKHGQWKPEGFAIEVADAIIRLGDICAKHNIDIDRAIDIKRAFNEGRPYLHGGKSF